MIKELVFIEFGDEVKILEKQIDNASKIIALQPCAQAELKKSGIQYSNSIPYFGTDGHASVLEKSSEIINALRPRLNIQDAIGVGHCYERTFIFYLRFYLHYWLTCLYIIDQSINDIKPDMLISTKSESEKIIGAQIENDSRFFSAIIKAYADTHEISVEYIVHDKAIKREEQKIRSNFVAKIIFEIFLFGYRVASRGKQILLVPADTYNIPRLLKKMGKAIPKAMNVFVSVRRSGFFKKIFSLKGGNTWLFAILPGRLPKKEYAEFNSKLDGVLQELLLFMRSNKEMFKYCDVDLAEPLSDYIKTNLKREMLRLSANVHALNKLVSARKPKAVFSQYSLGLGYALGELCNIKNIPAILISHGTHVPQDNKYANIEWSEHARTLMNTDYPYVATQTPWASKFLHQQKELVSKTIETGPLLFAKKSSKIGQRDELRMKLFAQYQNKTIIIHAGTPKPRNAIRPWVYETVDEYIKNINDLISAVEKTPGLYLAIRFRPSSMLTASDLKILLVESKCYDIYQDGSFEDYLLASDLLISYSSTTIEEALQNHIPVLQYDSDGKYCHIPAQKLHINKNNKVSPIYYAANKDELEYALNWINRNHLKGEKPNQDSWQQHSYDEKDEMALLSEMNVFG